MAPCDARHQGPEARGKHPGYRAIDRRTTIGKSLAPGVLVLVGVEVGVFVGRSTVIRYVLRVPYGGVRVVRGTIRSAEARSRTRVQFMAAIDDGTSRGRSLPKLPTI